MSELLDYEEEEPGGPRFDVRAWLFQLWWLLRRYYWLLALLLPLFVLGSLAWIAHSKPSYTATAVLGPTISLGQMQGLNGGGALQSVARHLSGGLLGGAGLSPTFNEFVSLLNSARLSHALAEKKGFLQTIFAGQWDPTRNRWRPRSGVMEKSLDFVKGIIGRAVKAAPDQDDVAKFLGANMAVSTSLETGYVTVSLKYPTRDGATQLLATILKMADDLIRQDQRHDVGARITYLENALKDVRVTDQREALIRTLSDQQQMMMIIASDDRYASAFIDPPYAPWRPTSPNPYSDMTFALLLAVGCWFTIVVYGNRVRFVRRLLNWNRAEEAGDHINSAETVDRMPFGTPSRSGVGTHHT